MPPAAFSCRQQQGQGRPQCSDSWAGGFLWFASAHPNEGKGWQTGGGFPARALQPTTPLHLIQHPGKQLVEVGHAAEQQGVGVRLLQHPCAALGGLHKGWQVEGGVL